MIVVTDALRVKTAYEYDAINRIVAIESPDGSERRMKFMYNQYEPCGKLFFRND